MINKINQEIRESFFNIIYLLCSWPLTPNQSKSSLTQQQQQQQNSLENCGAALASNKPDVCISSFYRSDLIRSLKETGKNLHLKFEVLTFKSFTEAFDSGSRILQLSLTMAHEDGLVAEDSDSAPYIISYQQMREIIQECRFRSRKSWLPNKGLSCEKNVELIILSCKNNMKLAEFFSTEMKIPFVITFVFKTREESETSSDPHILLYESEFIDKFSIFFFTELVEGRSVQKAFYIALRNAFDCIACSFFLGKETLVKNLLGEGAVLLFSPTNTEASTRKLFGSREFELPMGTLEEISTVFSPTNIQKSILPFVGRRGDILEIIKLLAQEEKTNFLKITGEAGSGKTQLVLKAAYYMLVRNHFPDGIFYFPLRKYWKTNLLDMLKKVLNSESFGSKFEKNIKNMFRNKKMLLIFDDFDSFYGNAVDFPSMIFSVLKLCQISTIVVTTSNAPKLIRTTTRNIEIQPDTQAKIESEFVQSTFKISRLSLEESGFLISLLTEMEFGVNANPHEITKLTAVKQAKGNVSKLIKLIKEEKIVVEDKILRLNPNYVTELDIDKKYKALVKKVKSEK